MNRLFALIILALSVVTLGAIVAAQGPYGFIQQGGLTAGGIPMVSSDGKSLTQDPTNLFWDIANHRLGLLTASPGATVDLAGKLTITSAGLLTKYNNVATVGNGVSIWVGSKTDSGFSTTQASANILASTGVSGQPYRVGYELFQASNGSGGVCNTNATATVAIGWNDPTGTAITVTEGAVQLPPTKSVTASYTGGAATGFQSHEFLISAQVNSAITRTITWANGNCNTQPTASALFSVEQKE